MAEFELEVRTRSEKEKGKERAKGLRGKGYVPGVVYGHGESAVPITLEKRNLSQILEKAHGDNIVFNVRIDGQGEAKAILKEVQRDPVTREITHVDFQHIHAGEALTVQVPVVLTGSSPGVKQGGILEHTLRKVQARCLPSQIPDHFIIDIGNLNLGDSLHVKDIDAGPVRILEDVDAAVVSVVVPRAKVEVTEAPEAAPEEAAAEEEAPEGEEEEEEKE
jgi:large subunit ribosomal protein L25